MVKNKNIMAAWRELPSLVLQETISEDVKVELIETLDALNNDNSCSLEEKIKLFLDYLTDFASDGGVRRLAININKEINNYVKIK